MAETVHLKLKANGQDIKGDSTQTSLERAETIECVWWEQGVMTAREKGSAHATGRRQHGPIKFRKRIDQSSPLIAKALTQNQVIEGEFWFFRPNPAGDGTSEKFFTVKFSKGRVSAFKQILPDCLVPATSQEPPLEEVEFVFGQIIWTYVPAGVEHQDSWAEGT